VKRKTITYFRKPSGTEAVMVCHFDSYNVVGVAPVLLVKCSRMWRHVVW